MNKNQDAKIKGILLYLLSEKMFHLLHLVKMVSKNMH